MATLIISHIKKVTGTNYILRCSQIFTAALIGFLAWNFYLPAAVLVPVIWLNSQNKKIGFLIGAAYHLSASHHLIKTAPVFFGKNLLFGVLLWAIAGLIQAIPYYFCFFKHKTAALFALFFALIIPPVGIVGWAHPLTTAGLFLPGSGFFGLFFLTIFIIGCSWSLKNNKILFFHFVFLIFLIPAINQNINPIKFLPMKSVSTNFKGHPESIFTEWKNDYFKFYALYNQYGDEEFETLVLPEGMAKIWLSDTEKLWEPWQNRLKSNQSILVTTLQSIKQLETSNTIVKISKKGTETLYNARQPVPFGMWRPWDRESTKTNWFTNPIFTLNGYKATGIICYEAYITFPILHSFIVDNPQIIIMTANQWWAKNSNLPSIQIKSIVSWAKLFNAQVVCSINY